MATDKPEKSSPAPAGIAGGASSKQYHSTALWTRLVQVLLLAIAGFAVANIVLTWSAFDQVQNVHRSASDVRILAGTGDTIGKAAIASLIPGALCGLAFLAFIYQSYLNLPGLDSDDTTFSPATAVLVMLVPVINILTTYFVLGELARESDASRINPTTQSGSAGKAVTLWWLVLLLSILASGGGAFLSSQASEPADVLLPLLVSMLASGLSIVHLALLIYIVGDIHANQALRRKLIVSPPTPIAVTRIPDFPEEARPHVSE
jgi:hypothetical protein